MGKSPLKSFRCGSMGDAEGRSRPVHEGASVPTVSDIAICLRRWDYSETSQIASLLTREHGLIRALAKGAKRERGSFSGGLDILSAGRLVAIVKPGRDLATLTEWRLEQLCRVVRRDLEANRAALYMADLIQHMLTDHDPHPVLFDALLHALDELEAPDQAAEVLLKLQWRVLDETGYRPELAQDVETGADLPVDAETYAFNPRAGGLVADGAGHDRWLVRRSTVELLRSMALDQAPETTDSETLERAQSPARGVLPGVIGSGNTLTSLAVSGTSRGESPEQTAPVTL